MADTPMGRMVNDLVPNAWMQTTVRMQATQSDATGSGVTRTPTAPQTTKHPSTP